MTFEAALQPPEPNQSVAEVVAQMPPDVALQHLGAMAYDMILRGGPDQAFLDSYGLSHDDLAALLAMPAMQSAVLEARGRINELSEKEGFSLRARMAAETLLGDMFKMARSATADPALRFKVFEAMTRLAKLDPGPAKAQTQAGAGVTVQFHIGAGVRGVSAPVVEVTPDE